jgi:hypothetical protein
VGKSLHRLVSELGVYFKLPKKEIIPAYSQGNPERVERGKSKYVGLTVVQ